MRQVNEELMPVLQQLQSEGFEVWSYECSRDGVDDEIDSLFWFENGRMLNIQPNSWRHVRLARDRYNIGVSYVPSHYGSGCSLSDYDCGTPASQLLSYREYPTWVGGITNYKSMADYLKHRSGVLHYRKLNGNGQFEEEQ